MVPARWLRVHFTIPSGLQRFLFRRAVAALFFGVFLFWTERIPNAHGVDGCSDVRSCRIVEIEKLGPARNNRPAMHDGLKYRVAARYSRKSCEISTDHGHNDRFHERSHASAGPICLSDVDRNCEFTSSCLRDPLVPRHAEARFHGLDPTTQISVPSAVLLCVPRVTSSPAKRQWVGLRSETTRPGTDGRD